MRDLASDCRKVVLLNWLCLIIFPDEPLSLLPQHALDVHNFVSEIFGRHSQGRIPHQFHCGNYTPEAACEDDAKTSLHMSKLKLVSLTWNLRQTCGELAASPGSQDALLNLCCAETAVASFVPSENEQENFLAWKASAIWKFLEKPLLETTKLKAHTLKEAAVKVKKSVASLGALACMQTSWREGLDDKVAFQSLAAKAKPTICKKDVVTPLKARVDEAEKDRLEDNASHFPSACQRVSDLEAGVRFFPTVGFQFAGNGAHITEWPSSNYTPKLLLVTRWKGEHNLRILQQDLVLGLFSQDSQGRLDG